MKFTKGIILGSLLTAGAMMMYSEGIDTNKKKRQLKNLGNGKTKHFSSYVIIYII